MISDPTLISAAKEGNITACKLLLEQGAEVNAMDEKGNTPLHYAAQGGYTELCKLLLEHGADVNVMGNRYCWTPLHFAAEEGCTETCKLLLEHGAQVKAKSQTNRTPPAQAGVAWQHGDLRVAAAARRGG